MAVTKTLQSSLNMTFATCCAKFHPACVPDQHISTYLYCSLFSVARNDWLGRYSSCLGGYLLCLQECRDALDAVRKYGTVVPETRTAEYARTVLILSHPSCECVLLAHDSPCSVWSWRFGGLRFPLCSRRYAQWQHHCGSRALLVLIRHLHFQHRNLSASHHQSWHSKRAQNCNLCYLVDWVVCGHCRSLATGK
jgi:hypothetical protein